MSDTERLVIGLCKHCSKAIKLLDGEYGTDGHWSHMSLRASQVCGEWAEPKPGVGDERYDPMRGVKF